MIQAGPSPRQKGRAAVSLRICMHLTLEQTTKILFIFSLDTGYKPCTISIEIGRWETSPDRIEERSIKSTLPEPSTGVDSRRKGIAAEMKGPVEAFSLVDGRTFRRLSRFNRGALFDRFYFEI